MNQHTGSAFSAAFPINAIDDIKRLEKTPLEQSINARSTYEIFVNSAAEFGNKVALRFLKTAEPGADHTAWSYSELLKGIHQTANMLHTLGVAPTDAISIMLPGCLEYHLALWGGEAAGIVNPLNPLLSDTHLISLMQAAESKVLIVWGEDTGAAYWTKALNVMHAVPSLQHVLRVPAHSTIPEEAAALPEGVQDFYQLMHTMPDDHLISARDIVADDVAAYFHTGGTTGLPKLAKHSHGNQVFTAWAGVQLQGMKSSDVTINGFPLFHVAGVLPGALAALSAGVEVVIPTTGLMRNPAVVKNYWKLAEFHRTTVLSAVPTALASIAAVPLDGADISSIKVCRTGAAPLPPELGARYRQLFNIAVRESWGMTEMAGISSISPPSVDSPIGCVGFPVPFSRYKVVGLDVNGHPQDAELPCGETGMLLVKSPNVFPGYLNEADTKKAFTEDGWLITGDLGFIDTAGRIHLSGRSKDLIIRSAHNIDPRIIEDALDAHPAVDLCAAVGAPDAYAGELPVAFVTLNGELKASVTELQAYAAERVDDMLAKPKSVFILDAMPMTNVGKIYKPELRRLASLTTVTQKAEAWLKDIAVDAKLDVVASMDSLGKVSVTVQLVSKHTDDTVLERLLAELKKIPVEVVCNNHVTDCATL